MDRKCPRLADGGGEPAVNLENGLLCRVFLFMFRGFSLHALTLGDRLLGNNSSAGRTSFSEFLAGFRQRFLRRRYDLLLIRHVPLLALHEHSILLSQGCRGALKIPCPDPDSFDPMLCSTCPLDHALRGLFFPYAVPAGEALSSILRTAALHQRNQVDDVTALLPAVVCIAGFGETRQKFRFRLIEKVRDRSPCLCVGSGQVQVA